MNRQQKIDVLKGLQTGRANIESLLPRECHIFDYDAESGLYDRGFLEPEIFTQSEYAAFCNKIAERNLLRPEGERHQVITMLPMEGCEPITE